MHVYRILQTNIDIKVQAELLVGSTQDAQTNDWVYTTLATS